MSQNHKGCWPLAQAKDLMTYVSLLCVVGVRTKIQLLSCRGRTRTAGSYTQYMAAIDNVYTAHVGQVQVSISVIDRSICTAGSINSRAV
jgi:hypothetical protein